MLSRMEIETIIAKLCGEVTRIFPQDKIDAILFGSYARGDAEFGSDIDVLLLVGHVLSSGSYLRFPLKW